MQSAGVADPSFPRVFAKKKEEKKHFKTFTMTPSRPKNQLDIGSKLVKKQGNIYIGSKLAKKTVKYLHWL